MPPTRIGTEELVEIATLALQSQPSLLLLDNLHLASEGMLPTIERLIEAAAEVAIASLPAKTALQRRKQEFLVSRATLKEVKPLNRLTALAVVRTHLPPDIRDPQPIERRLLELGKGHPASLVRLATQTKQGTVAEVRDYRSTQAEPINLTWLLLVSLFGFLLWWRADSYVIVALAGFIFYALRRYVMSRMFALR